MRRDANYRGMKRIVLLACALSAFGVAVPANAAGGLWGTAAITGGCGGGSMAITATNTNGNNWVFHVNVLCTNASPQSLTVAGNWDANVGGPVLGFGTGSLQVGRVTCGSSSNVTVQTAMVLSPLITGRATITRSCF